MKKSGKVTLLVITVLIICAAAAALFLGTGPARSLHRAEQFVERYAETLEPLLDTGKPIPVLPEVTAYNVWSGEHPMMEFLLKPRFAVYVGCYYSPDDVPLAFQNTDFPLVPNGEDSWSWQGSGDNRGITRKIRDHWYYFEASF